MARGRCIYDLSYICPRNSSPKTLEASGCLDVHQHVKIKQLGRNLPCSSVSESLWLFAARISVNSAPVTPSSSDLDHTSNFSHDQIPAEPWHCCPMHHLFHAPLYFANDAWCRNVANLTALPALKGYSPLIKAEVRPFIATSPSLIVLGVSRPGRRWDN